MKAPRPLKGHRKTGHWLTDALYTIPREQGTTLTGVSVSVLNSTSRASVIATNCGKALADMDRFFNALGYEIELVAIQPKGRRT